MNTCLRRRRLLRVGVRTALIAAGAAAALVPAGAVTDGQPDASLHHILAQGELRVITGNSPHSFHTYRNEAMGFDYELAREFAAHLNVRLKIIPRETWRDMVAALEAGEGDLIAGAEITPTRSVSSSGPQRKRHFGQIQFSWWWPITAGGTRRSKPRSRVLEGFGSLMPMS